MTTQTVKVWRKKSKTIENQSLQNLQRRFALGTVLVPTIGFVAAIALLWFTGISSVEIGLFVGMYIVTVGATEVGFHRHFAHRSFEAKPTVRAILAILGSMAGQGPVIYWAATHRHHHQHSDLPEDPHSPYIHEGKQLGWWHGLWHSHIGWFFSSKMTNAVFFAKDLIQDPLIVKISQLYLVWIIIGLAIPAVLGGIITWTWMGALKGLLWGGFVRMFVGQHATWSIGSVAHIWGNRAFDTREHSRNNFLLTIPTLGGGWHNNHHAFPNSALAGLEWWQIDPTGWTIQALEKLGLAWDVKRPTQRLINARKKNPSESSVDL
ncbi:MAG: acyl-CoA desaturase [Komarekiella atlantica HA4396-MV6]|jgi:stearoyl-CoA desaturase (delta-9 desaturase)|nr:acyl-CoA desaturase [Komarekiella atlantica HA4396-MV6]